MRKDSVSYRVVMLFCSNAVLQLMGFVYRIALSRAAGSAALGLNSLIMQIYGIVVSVCISGLNVAVANTAAKTDTGDLAQLFSSALAVYFALFSCMAIPIGLFSRSISSLALGNTEAYRTLLLMLACIFMTGIENVLKSIHFGVKLAGRCAASELLEQAVRFAVVIFLLHKLHRDSDADTVFLIMLGMLASEFVSVTNLSLSFIKRFYLRRSSKRISFIRPLVHVAFPATLTAVSSTLFSSAAALRLPVYLMRGGASYGFALSSIGELNTVYVPITMLPMAFALAVSTVIMPEISDIASRGKDPMPLIRKAFAVTAAVGAACLVVLSLLGDDAAWLFFRRVIDKRIVTLLLIKTFTILLQVVSVAAMNGLMMQKQVFMFAVTGEAYQLLLVRLMAPVLGLCGYIIAMAVGEGLRLACNLCCIFARRKNGVEIRARI